jgi:hypothetical protein
MLPREQELLDRIKEAEADEAQARRKVSSLKKTILERESELITIVLGKEALLEALRVLRATSVSHAQTEQQKESERFNALYPELLKKIK